MSISIAIYHSQATVDPSAQYAEDRWPEIASALEDAYSAAILAKYPEADIEFVREESLNSIRVIADEDEDQILSNVERICGKTFEAGDFWPALEA